MKRESNTYAGIGSRESPPDILGLMSRIAVVMAHRGYGLRSGGATGADSAFHEGCRFAGGRCEIFLPWAGFAGLQPSAEQGIILADPESEVYMRALAIAQEFHPAWQRLSRGARALQTRNTFQVLGATLDDPVKQVICWTPQGSGSGGTGQAIRIAKARGIPVMDLGLADKEAEARYKVSEYFDRHAGVEPPGEAEQQKATAPAGTT